MAVQNSSRVTPRQQAKRAQARADRTQALVMEETVRCVREEGFAAASTRRIIERAGVTWGVIQYHFGDRDGLLAAVIEQGLTNLADTLDAIVDEAADIKDGRARAEMLTSQVWSLMSTPECMATLEILIATRSMRGTLVTEELSGVQSALARLAGLLGDGAATPAAIANLLWSSAVGMMVAQMANSAPLPTHDEQQAIADVITDRLSTRRRRRAGS
jgi:TetR/AcrR family transcriptional regulator, regulator of cefoperazone and chloramphenicol sensitivity